MAEEADLVSAKRIFAGSHGPPTSGEISEPDEDKKETVLRTPPNVVFRKKPRVDESALTKEVPDATSGSWALFVGSAQNIAQSATTTDRGPLYGHSVATVASAIAPEYKDPLRFFLTQDEIEDKTKYNFSDMLLRGALPVWYTNRLERRVFHMEHIVERLKFSFRGICQKAMDPDLIESLEFTPLPFAPNCPHRRNSLPDRCCAVVGGTSTRKFERTLKNVLCQCCPFQIQVKQVRPPCCSPDAMFYANEIIFFARDNIDKLYIKSRHDDVQVGVIESSACRNPRKIDFEINWVRPCEGMVPPLSIPLYIWERQHNYGDFFTFFPNENVVWLEILDVFLDRHVLMDIILSFLCRNERVLLASTLRSLLSCSDTTCRMAYGQRVLTEYQFQDGKGGLVVEKFKGQNTPEKRPSRKNKKPRKRRGNKFVVGNTGLERVEGGVEEKKSESLIPAPEMWTLARVPFTPPRFTYPHRLLRVALLSNILNDCNFQRARDVSFVIQVTHALRTEAIKCFRFVTSVNYLWLRQGVSEGLWKLDLQRDSTYADAKSSGRDSLTHETIWGGVHVRRHSKYIQAWRFLYLMETKRGRTKIARLAFFEWEKKVSLHHVSPQRRRVLVRVVAKNFPPCFPDPKYPWTRVENPIPMEMKLGSPIVKYRGVIALALLRGQKIFTLPLKPDPMCVLCPGANVDWEKYSRFGREMLNKIRVAWSEWENGGKSPAKEVRIFSGLEKCPLPRDLFQAREVLYSSAIDAGLESVKALRHVQATNNMESERTIDTAGVDLIDLTQEGDTTEEDNGFVRTFSNAAQCVPTNLGIKNPKGGEVISLDDMSDEEIDSSIGWGVVEGDLEKRVAGVDLLEGVSRDEGETSLSVDEDDVPLAQDPFCD